MSRRCFISVDIQNQGIVDRLKEIQHTIQPHGKINLTSPEQLHVTMNFIGDVNEEELDDIKDSLSNISFPPFSMELQGLGAFPSKDFITVVWAGVGPGKEKIAQLASSIRERMEKKYVQEQAFHPHVTLARVNNLPHKGKKRLQQLIEKHATTSFGNVNVTSFKMKESTLDKNGAQHTTLHTFPLR